jgi:hypothetical protein
MVVVPRIPWEWGRFAFKNDTPRACAQTGLKIDLEIAISI